MIAEPELYALVHCGTPGDEAFYAHACQGAETVLELGCGYGRILTALAARGHRVTGIDLDPGLLALARAGRQRLTAPQREAISLQHDDMRGFAVPGCFRRVIIPYNGLYCLADESEQVACLRAAARHLDHGGQVIFDAYAIDAFHAEADPRAPSEDDGEPVATVRWRDRTWDVHEHTDWDRDAQRLTARYAYRARDGSATRSEVIHHRYLLTGQLCELCARAGLRLVSAHGDFQGAPLESESEHMVAVATRA